MYFCSHKYEHLKKEKQVTSLPKEYWTSIPPEESTTFTLPSPAKSTSANDINEYFEPFPLSPPKKTKKESLGFITWSEGCRFAINCYEPNCREYFTDHGLFAKHLKTSHRPNGETKHNWRKCPLCEKIVFNAGQLIGHISKHLGVRAYECLKCGHKCRFRTVVRNHMKFVHSLDIGFEGRKRSSQRTQKTKPTPKDSKPLKSTKMNVKRRRSKAKKSQLPPPSTSTSIKPSPEDLKPPKSIKIKHPPSKKRQLPAIALNKALKFSINCRNCGILFVDRAKHRKHLKTVHFAKSTWLTCPDCEKKYSNTDHFLGHLFVSHDRIQPFTCILKSGVSDIRCGRSFAHPSSFRSHVLSTHGYRIYTPRNAIEKPKEEPRRRVKEHLTPPPKDVLIGRKRGGNGLSRNVPGMPPSKFRLFEFPLSFYVLTQMFFSQENEETSYSFAPFDSE